jgi:tRNA A-37 threonylcarbamoyl transferase component Bud32
MDTQSPDLVLLYKADASRNGLLFAAATAPVWAFWMPWVMFEVVRAVFQDALVGTLASDLDLMALAFFFAFVSSMAALNILVCKDNRLVIGARGVKIPVRFWLQSLGRCHFPWKDLSCVAFERNGVPSAEAEEICFQFAGRAKAPMRLSGFQREDIPKILLALQAYAPQAEVVPSTDAIKGLSPDRVAQPLTFTHIWEEELNSRFGSTIFVPLEPGHKMLSGRLEVVGQIAFGGLSAIYLSKLDGKELVVLKEAVVPQNADAATKEKALEMFKREAGFLVTLKHPRIARVFDHFVENGRDYMLLQYIEGKDLRTYIKENGPQPEQVVARWAKEIAEILVYLHSLNPPIVHRDLTPDNLVLARDGSICMIDFGAANNFMGTATGTLVGKQSYISPEQFRGKATPASDYYSLGCTLSFLLTGKDPEPLSVSHPKELQPLLSPQFDELVAALTQQEVQDRLQPGSAVLDQIEKLCGRVLTAQRELEHHGGHH